MRPINKAVVTLLVFVIALAIFCEVQLRKPITLTASGFLEISRGDSLTSVTDVLVASSVVTVPKLLFKVYGLLTRFEGTIKAGEYRLEHDLNAKTLLRLLRQGRVVQRQITFPEGWNFSEWCQALLDNQFLERTLADASEQRIMRRLGS